jgi:hypothetical protein
MTEEEIYAPPRDSSDEEDDTEKKDNTANATTAPASKSLVAPKRPPLPTIGARRSKRQKLQDDPDALAIQPTTEPEPERQTSQKLVSQSTEWETMQPHSQSSQRRAQRTFKKRLPPPTAHNPSDSALVIPAAVSAVAKDVPDENGSGGLRDPRRNIDTSERHDRPALKVFAAPTSAAPSSSGTSRLTASSAFGSDVNHEHNGNGSTPTTPISIDDYNISDGEDEQSEADAECCPCCLQKVVRSRLSDPGIDLRQLRFLPLDRQQHFCHEHRLADAKVTYKERGYPGIDWSKLRRYRINKHLDKLQSIAQRERPSGFLEELDAQVSNHSRKQVLEFIQEQIKDIELFPPGFYGPKGTHVMAEVVTQKLSRYLSGKIRDATIQAIGVGPFVSAVLVPELTVLLTMEDMNVDEEQARVVMRESAPIGMLVHPEDDKVVVDLIE